MFPVTAVPYRPPRLPWWAWRRRSKRLEFLELVAQTEFRVSLNGTPRLAMSFGQAYISLRHNATADVLRGVSYVNLAHLSARDSGQDVSVSLRMPLELENSL